MVPIITRFLRALLGPVIFVVTFLYRVFWSGLNGRNVFQMVFTFWINFAPVFIWLMIFKNAGLIPTEIRPPIFVNFAFEADDFVFNIESPLSALFSLGAISGIAALLYYKIYSQTPKDYGHPDLEMSENLPRNSNQYKAEPQGSDSSSTSSSEPESFELEDFSSSSNFIDAQNSAPGDFQDDPHHKSIEYLRTLSHADIARKATAINNKIVALIKRRGNYMPINCWYLSVPILIQASWFLLNFDYWLREPINVRKDILAWASYVLGHFFAPLFTAIWLYVFHAPGSLKLFSFALGMQNIAGVMTHLLFPNAPPWFIHMDDPDLVADYSTPGYAAGLTRVDIAMGTHMHSQGFHASPIVFGALPSLHSAMAVMVFFFLSYYSRWTFLKLVGLAFVILQWWATIYLDHHWRIDLIVGMMYSVTSFTLLYVWKRGFRKVDHDFLVARLRFDFKKGSTMGMRVFRNTSWQDFFDPFS